MAESGSVVLVYVTDSGRQPVAGAEVEVRSRGNVSLGRDKETGATVVSGLQAGEVALVVARAGGGESKPLAVTVTGGVQQVVVGMPADGELTYRRGDSRAAFVPDHDRFLVYTDGPGAGRLAAAAFRDLGLAAEELPGPGGGDARDDKAFEEVTHLVAADPDRLAKLPSVLDRQAVDVRIARPVLHKDGTRPYGLTGEIVAAFRGDVKREEVARIAAEHGLEVARDVRHAGNGFLLVRKGMPDYDLLEVAEALAADDRVAWAEPNLVVPLELDAWTPNDLLYGQVPHLQVVNADDAWDRMDNVAVALRGGSPNITVAVFDPQGVAPNHPDLAGNLTDGTAKLVASINFRATPIAAQTVAALAGDHGTQCAGSATAIMDDNRGLPGVAPNCHLIGGQNRSNSDELRLADAYLWMSGFANGSTDAGFPALPGRTADVISSSFGVTGAVLSTTMRTCFDHLTTFGRGGRGVVVCFSLGNSGYGDFTNAAGTRFRAWPTYEKCIAVGSSLNTNPTNPVTSVHADPNGNTTGIATQVDRRALYSPFGATALRKPDLVSPSHTSYSTAAGNPLVDTILSDVRVGTGTVDGCPGATTCLDYDTTFGGTSHSTPTVAGAVALVLSARPELSWVQVREVLRRSCARIDAANADPTGQWQDLNGDGAIDYSRWYGSGRLDVDAAVALVLDPAVTFGDAYVRENLADVGDVPSPGWHAESPDIWVRRTDDPVPALAWTSSPPHENPVRGSDNFVFCRVRNRGTAVVPTVYLRASITHYPGFEFRYPQEFRPTTNVGDPIPNPLVPGTYVIGEVRVDNLGPGADTIVKLTWPAALIPPEEVTVGGVDVRWHPCLLLESSPHDGPAPAPGAIAVRADNNLAQRNISIGDPGDVDSWVGAVAGSLDRGGIRSIVLDGRLLDGDVVVLLHVADRDKEVRAGLSRGAKQAFVPKEEIRLPGRLPDLSVILRDRTRINVGGAGGLGGIEIHAAPGTELRLPPGVGRPAAVAAVPVAGSDTVDGVPVVMVKGLPGGILEIPAAVPGSRLFPLAIGTRGEWKGELRITQRRGDGSLSPGYTIRH